MCVWVVLCALAAAPSLQSDSEDETEAITAARPHFELGDGTYSSAFCTAKCCVCLRGEGMRMVVACTDSLVTNHAHAPHRTETDFTPDGSRRLGADDVARLKKLPLVEREVWQVAVKPLQVWAASPEGPSEGPDAIPYRPLCAFLFNVYPAGTPLAEKVGRRFVSTSHHAPLLPHSAGRLVPRVSSRSSVPLAQLTNKCKHKQGGVLTTVWLLGLHVVGHVSRSSKAR